MKKSVLTFLLIPLVILGITFFITPKTSFAAVPATITPTEVDENTAQVTVQFTGLTPNTTYDWCGDDSITICEARKQSITSDASGNITIDNLCGYRSTLVVQKSGGCAEDDFYWGDVTYHVTLYSWPISIGAANFKVKRIVPEYHITSDNGFKPGAIITATIKGSRRPIDSADRNLYKLVITGSPDPDNNSKSGIQVLNNAEQSIPFNNLNIFSGNYKITLTGQGNGSEDGYTFGTITFKIDAAGGSILSSTGPTSGAAGAGNNPCSTAGCETALGLIPTSVKEFAAKILGIATGIAGGIALILMVIGSVRVLASSGDPKAVGAGREMIVAAVAGLLFLIFAVLILRFIGVNIFSGVPGMGP